MFCAAAAERRVSVDNQEVHTQPTMQMEVEVNPHSEVSASIADTSVEPSESRGAGLAARQGHVRRSATVQPHEGLYSELANRLSHAQGNEEKVLYTELRLPGSAAGTSEHGVYIEIP